MNENIFLVWNGWGLLFTGIIALSHLYILLTINMGPTPLRNLLGWVILIAIILSFIYSGWIVGLFAFPLGWIGSWISAVILGRLFVICTEKHLMNFFTYIIYSIPTILVTWFFDFIPWGLVTAVATPIVLTLIAATYPKKRYIKMNLKTAMEGLSYGDLDNAKDLILIAIREAENSSKLEKSLLKEICDACDRITSAIENTGQFKEAQSLREQCSNLTTRYINTK